MVANEPLRWPNHDTARAQTHTWNSECCLFGSLHQERSFQLFPASPFRVEITPRGHQARSGKERKDIINGWEERNPVIV